jgi:tellurite resistance protein TerC
MTAPWRSPVRRPMQGGEDLPTGFVPNWREFAVHWGVWVLFVAAIVALLAVDLIWFRRTPGAGTTRQALVWSAIWLVIGVGFTPVVLAWHGPDAAGQYLTGYLIERSLSVDNLFVFAMAFASFGLPPALQQRTLLFGVVGALAMRGALIAGGAALLETFHATVYIFGAVLLLTGIRFAIKTGRHEGPGDFERSPILRAVRRVVPTTSGYRGERLLVHEHGRWLATPLLAVLIVVVVADVAFAIDSVPAIFAVTSDAFLVFAANAFALLGLRAMFFLLAGMMDRFEYLQWGLAAIMVFIGAKMLAADIVHIPTWVSLAVIAVGIGLPVLASMRARSPAATAGSPRGRSR